MADVGDIMSYESGDLSAWETLHLFSDLIKDDMIRHLQGHYGRVAQALIATGLLTGDGDITPDAEDRLAMLGDETEHF